MESLQAVVTEGDSAQMIFTRDDGTSGVLGVAYTVRNDGTTDADLVGGANGDGFDDWRRAFIEDGLSSVSVIVGVSDDALAAGSGSFHVEIEDTSGARSAYFTIDDNEPTPWVEATDDEADEAGPDNATFAIHRAHPSLGGYAVTVVYTLGGTATRGTGVGPGNPPPLDADYLTAAGSVFSVTIPAWQESVNVNVAPLADADDNETVVLTLIADPTTGGPFYHPPGGAGPSSATATIKDDPPKVTLSAIDAVAAETASGAPPDLARFRVERPGSGRMIAYALAVDLAGDSSGAATPDTDFAVPASVTIPAGENYAEFDLTPADDADPEWTEEAVVRVEEAARYAVTGTGRAPRSSRWPAPSTTRTTSGPA